jgi:hypothetical protein
MKDLAIAESLDILTFAGRFDDFEKIRAQCRPVVALNLKGDCIFVHIPARFLSTTCEYNG